MITADYTIYISTDTDNEGLTEARAYVDGECFAVRGLIGAAHITEEYLRRQVGKTLDLCKIYGAEGTKKRLETLDTEADRSWMFDIERHEYPVIRIPFREVEKFVNDTPTWRTWGADWKE